jgi:hypothetical protein
MRDERVSKEWQEFFVQLKMMCLAQTITVFSSRRLCICFRAGVQGFQLFISLEIREWRML